MTTPVNHRGLDENESHVGFEKMIQAEKDINKKKRGHKLQI